VFAITGWVSRERQQNVSRDPSGEGARLYAGFGVLAVAYFWLRVPETKNRSLEEIEPDLGVKEEDLSSATAA
jgi:hypothetical protein